MLKEDEHVLMPVKEQLERKPNVSLISENPIADW